MRRDYTTDDGLSKSVDGDLHVFDARARARCSPRPPDRHPGPLARWSAARTVAPTRRRQRFDRDSACVDPNAPTAASTQLRCNLCRRSHLSDPQRPTVASAGR